ncbi:hypothetical protein CRI70_29780 [Streptomyces sp. Ru87]|uniref:VCBS repeat-containing protein n=2 Tax=Streptomyces TaxID=1883 RepID=A0ABQ7FFY5_9ACTN|nr:VCBS repeat-containing protein [Streptomyces lycii]PGH47209.1 hypothetical protein CRI70_29780 [Streptomyces sp. Ru87]
MPRILTVCAAGAVLVPLAGCGTGGTDRTPSASAKTTRQATTAPGPPAESRAPQRGKGSKDPDDINGDGHRDLVLPVRAGDARDDRRPEERIAVVYGSAGGLDPATRTVHGRRDLGLPEPPDGPAWQNRNTVSQVVTADLDGDGFPDFVTPVDGETATDGNLSTASTVPYVTWGGPTGPRTGRKATPVRLPDSAAKPGVESVVRGDFDGDGHHDLAGAARNESSLVLLYGPFTRDGRPARTDTGLPWSDGRLYADAIDPSGKPRATSLLLHAMSDGEQTASTLYRARRGTGPSPEGRELRKGNAHAFGDFDGDGLRDVAVGDDGSRNNEPGHETEAPGVGGSLAVYPGSGDAPVTHRLPERPGGASSYYGPGGYTAADPDGDGRDGVLVATYEGATLIDGDRRTAVLREGPAEADGEKTPARWRHARPAGAADFDGDGEDELVLHWGPGTSFGLYGDGPTHWWITEGTSAGDQASFATTEFAAESR